ncbi:hypothetical protein J8F10_31865 [Gemmata sp. G18]|uniref:Helix-turn-helix domain-containing protein n=1 Tax=Gemmata palustris TaxID=2822762 RepID=A0ABS5C1M9_9BACT|nr:hypothetical protein [Gemmata palustris]MBP3959869.1 hypothetical protein [Gemmata palustris]
MASDKNKREGRSGADEALAAQIAAGKTLKEAAEATGVAERTTRRRMQNPQFRAMVADLRGQMIGRACGELADAMGAAAKTLRELLGSETEGIKLRAASEILSHGLKVMEIAELKAKFEELEQRLEWIAKQ